MARGVATDATQRRTTGAETSDGPHQHAERQDRSRRAQRVGALGCVTVGKDGTVRAHAARTDEGDDLGPGGRKSMTTPTARLEDAWPQLTELSDVYTCYSSAVAAWAAYSHPSWESLVNPGLWLVVKPAEDMLFGFGHFRPGLRAALGLARAGSDDADEAVAGILAELKRGPCDRGR